MIAAIDKGQLDDFSSLSQPMLWVLTEDRNNDNYSWTVNVITGKSESVSQLLEFPVIYIKE